MKTATLKFPAPESCNSCGLTFYDNYKNDSTKTKIICAVCQCCVQKSAELKERAPFCPLIIEEIND